MNNLDLKQIAPRSITRDEKVKALCDAITIQLKDVYDELGLELILPRLDELDDDILDLLAWQYHVDFYEYAASQTKKRNAIRNSIAWHRYKGTPRAVQEVVENFFSSAVVQENWEYGGIPFHFRVWVIRDPLNGEETLENLVRAIYVAKNVRSWLDEVGFSREIYGNIYYGCGMCVCKHIEIRQVAPNMPDLKQTIHYANGVKVNKHVEILPIIPYMPDLEQNVRYGSGLKLNRKVSIYG